MRVFSSQSEVKEIGAILRCCAQLPIVGSTIPGGIMESVFADVRGAERLATYDFVDVVNREKKTGWQIKSTKAETPVTWKRAKIPNSEKLIRETEKPEKQKIACRELGHRIITLCNEHIIASFQRYKLEAIGYVRLIRHPDGSFSYFERNLATKESPILFDPENFDWEWSHPKRTEKKEQLPALRGMHRITGKLWWAWHGRGENQLHFMGERTWWPSKESGRLFKFKAPAQKFRFEDLPRLFENSASVLGSPSNVR